MHISEFDYELLYKSLLLQDEQYVDCAENLSKEAKDFLKFQEKSIEKLKKYL